MSQNVEPLNTYLGILLVKYVDLKLNQMHIRDSNAQPALFCLLRLLSFIYPRTIVYRTLSSAMYGLRDVPYYELFCAKPFRVRSDLPS